MKKVLFWVQIVRHSQIEISRSIVKLVEIDFKFLFIIFFSNNILHIISNYKIFLKK